MLNTQKSLRFVLDGLTDFVTVGSKLNEAETRRVIIDRVLTSFGWDMTGLSDLRTEYPVFGGQADYVLFAEDAPYAVVEAKELNTNLDAPKHIMQAVNYGNALNAPWAILTNGKEWRVYGVHARCSLEDKLAARISAHDHRLDLNLDILESVLARETASIGSSADWWSRIEVKRSLEKTRVLRHHVVADPAIKRLLLGCEQYLGIEFSPPARRGLNTIVGSDGSTVHFSVSSPWMGKEDHAYIQVSPCHFERDWLAVMKAKEPGGWILPFHVVRDFLNSVKVSDRKRGGRAWDPKLGPKDGRDWLWQQWKNGRRDITDYRAAFNF